jgi:hypothetical protein
MTRDEVIAAITHAARAVVHAGGSQASVASLDAALQAADAEGYGDAARAVAAAIVEELGDAPAASAAPAQGVPLTVTVDWRLSKPPEKEPTWRADLNGTGKKAMRSFRHSFTLDPASFTSTMETAAGAKKMADWIDRLIKKEANGEPAWLVYAELRAGVPEKDTAAAASNLPRLLETSYWMQKMSTPSTGPLQGWWLGRPKFGGGTYYDSFKVKSK